MAKSPGGVARRASGRRCKLSNSDLVVRCFPLHLLLLRIVLYTPHCLPSCDIIIVAPFMSHSMLILEKAVERSFTCILEDV